MQFGRKKGILYEVPAQAYEKALIGFRLSYDSTAEKEVKIMKAGIHPDYYQATVTCNCGNTFVTGSTKEDIHVEICSKCHPFYTGQQKAAQARGRIDKFNKKYGVSNN